jgi:hypothetical protein
MSLYQSTPSSKSPLTAADKAARTLSFGAEQADRPHTVPREVGDLRSDTERAFRTLEGRVGLPSLLLSTGTIAEAGGTNELVLYGENLFAGRARASANVGGVIFTAHRPGKPGNDITVTLVQGGGATTITVDGSSIDVTLAADTTRDDLKTEIEGDPDAAALVSVSTDGNDGAAVLAAAATSLAGGTGDGMRVTAYYVNNGALNSALLAIDGATASTLSVVDGQLAGLAAGDVVAIQVDSHTAQSQTLHVVVS